MTNEATSDNNAQVEAAVPTQDAAAGDNISFIQQQQQQVYFIPPAVYPCLTYQYQSVNTSMEQNGTSGAELPNHQESQVPLQQHLPQVSVPVPGTVAYQMHPQLPSNQMAPNIAAAQCQTVVYQTPNGQLATEASVTTQQECDACVSGKFV